MAWSMQQVWHDDEDGPRAFVSIQLFNQRVWDAAPHRADAAVCEAIHTGGFNDDHIRRRVGNYEGQIMAIRRGFAAKDKLFGWRITDGGRAFLQSQDKSIPSFLDARDNWHGTQFEYCLWEVACDGQPFLKFAKELYPRVSVGMEPLFSRENATALRDFISDWLARTARAP